MEEFQAKIQASYKTKKGSIQLGGAMLDGTPVPNTGIHIPLKTLNRHGLIAGATGTGKTKSMQVMVEQLSLKGIPSLVLDMKGDLSGLAKPGKSNDHIVWRQGAVGLDYNPQGIPVEMLSISEELGTRLRATVSEFGPVLISKILDLNATQSGIVSLLFKYCDDHSLALIDLDDLRKALQFISQEGKEEIEAEYGYVSSVSVSAILRKIIVLEQQGAERFFGEHSFDVQDLCRTNSEGKGIASVLRITDIQDKPHLFSTFMLCILAEVYATFPEQGDADEPKLCIFIDEAHLVFKNAGKALQSQIESMVKLIRSKGVGIFFCTQLPNDIPDEVLSQLGLKVQHALRAFTAKARKSIVKAAENFPISEYYETDELLGAMGTGEALVTCLSEKGRPTELAHTLLRAPISRMGILSDSELKDVVSASEIHKKYAETLNRESAYEILTQKIDLAKEQQEDQSKPVKRAAAPKRAATPKKSSEGAKILKQLGTVLIRELTRGLLSVLGVKRR